MSGFIIRVPGDPGPPPTTPEYPACPCDRTELRTQYRGAKRVRVAVHQCLACGRSLGSVRRGKLGFAGLPDFDYALREAKNRERSEWWAVARDRQQAAWWEWYSAYLLSPKWHAKRAKVLARDRNTCRAEGCGKPATQVHHLTYERVGDELLDDLVSVCDDCHDKCHPRKG